MLSIEKMYSNKNFDIILKLFSYFMVRTDTFRLSLKVLNVWQKSCEGFVCCKYLAQK